MPGAWDSMWDTPLATTTQGREAAAPVPYPGTGNRIAPFPPTQSRIVPVPVATTQRPSGSIRVGRAVPLPTTPPTFPGARDTDYNPFRSLEDPAAEIPGDTPEVVKPSSPRYELFADTSDTGGNNDVVKDNKPPIVIAVFGQTGTGKTSFIKAVTGRDLQVGHSLTSCETHRLDLE